jgi:hypothetical protein
MFPHFVAETQLIGLKGMQGYPLLLLTLIGAGEVDQKIRKSAAVHFKGLINEAWKPAVRSISDVFASFCVPFSGSVELR